MVIDRIGDLLSELFDVPKETIGRNTNFFDDLGADSLDMVEFATMLEEEFDLCFTSEVTYEHKTVGEVADYVESLIA